MSIAIEKAKFDGDTTMRSAQQCSKVKYSAVQCSMRVGRHVVGRIRIRARTVWELFFYLLRVNFVCIVLEYLCITVRWEQRLPSLGDRF